MYCKSCGKTIDGNPMQCPYCNAKIVYEGGNGFWDIAKFDDVPVEKRIPDRPQTPVAKSTEASSADKAVLQELSSIKQQIKEMRQKKSAVLPIVLTLIVCSFFIFTLVILRSQLAELSSQFAGLHGSINAISDSIAKMQVTIETTPEPEKTPTPTPVVVKQPEDVNLPEDCAGTLFSVEVCAAGVYDSWIYKWQYSGTDGEFLDLDKNAMLERELMDELKENGGHRTYILKTDDLNNAAEGNYRLLLEAPDGTKIESDAVTLTVIQKNTGGAEG